jgi:hypothetical protein
LQLTLALPIFPLPVSGAIKTGAAPNRCSDPATKLLNFGQHQSPEETTMLNQKFFEDMSAKLNEAVANSPAKDFEKNARALLAQGFSKLDLVTREEFDVQAQVLARAREQLTALEARVTELEAQRK